MTTAQPHNGRRWTPFSISMLATAIIVASGFLGWCGDTAVKSMGGRLDKMEGVITNFQVESRVGQEKLWGAFTEYKKCENQSMVDCGCKRTDIC